MPSNWLYIDTNFPTFTGEEDTEEKVTTIQNYMFMLVEQLRYTLHNLDLANMNKVAVERYETSLTEPIYARIEDGEEHIAELALTAAGLALRLSDAEGNITSLTATAAGLTLRMNDAEGNITSLAATAEGLSIQISDAEDDIIQLGITAQGLATQVSDAQGQITTLQQTVNGFSISASNGSNSSTLYLTSNGITMSSARITFSGMVTFTDLYSSGATTINGDNIVTGTIRAITMQGNDIIGGTVTGATLRSVSSTDNGLEIYYGAVTGSLLVGGIRFDNNGAGTEEEAANRMFIYTNSGYANWAMKLQSGGGMSLESRENIYIDAATGLVLRAGGNLNIEKPRILTSSRSVWELTDSGIYYDGDLVISSSGIPVSGI